MSFCELRDWRNDCELRVELDLRVLFVLARLEVVRFEAVRLEAVLRFAFDALVGKELELRFVFELDVERVTLLPRALREDWLRDEFFLFEDVRAEAAARASPKFKIRACPAMNSALSASGSFLVRSCLEGMHNHTT